VRLLDRFRSNPRARASIDRCASGQGMAERSVGALVLSIFP
jgi:hypothetical protein